MNKRKKGNKRKTVKTFEKRERQRAFTAQASLVGKKEKKKTEIETVSPRARPPSSFPFLSQQHCWETFGERFKRIQKSHRFSKKKEEGVKNVQYNPPKMALRDSLSFFLGGGGLRHGTVRECRHNFSVLFFFIVLFQRKKKKRYGKQLCAEPIKEYKSARICCNVHLLFFFSLISLCSTRKR